MPSTAGRFCEVYFSVDDSAASYHLVAGIDSISGGPETPEITDDEFGIQFEQSITGIKGLPFSMSGGARIGADTNGQDAIAAAQDSGVSPNGYLAVFFGGTGAGFGWKGPVNFTKMAFDTKTRDKTNISIDGKTTGAYTFGAITLPS